MNCNEQNTKCKAHLYKKHYYNNKITFNFRNTVLSCFQIYTDGAQINSANIYFAK